MTNADDPVVVARGRLTAAMHAMHADQRILVDEALARELEMAWWAYDRALLEKAGALGGKAG